MNEDDLYRSSSQYKYWSFTTEALESLRASTNSAAAARVKAAIKRGGNKASNGNGATNGTANGDLNSQDAERDIDCLTIEEEAKLVQFYCTLCLKLSDSFDFPVPINVKVNIHLYSLLYVSLTTLTFLFSPKSPFSRFRPPTPSTNPTLQPTRQPQYNT